RARHWLARLEAPPEPPSPHRFAEPCLPPRSTRGEHLRNRRAAECLLERAASPPHSCGLQTACTTRYRSRPRPVDHVGSSAVRAALTKRLPASARNRLT